MSETTAADVVAAAIREIHAQLAPLQTALDILNGRSIATNVSVRVVAATPNEAAQTEVTVQVPMNGNGQGTAPAPVLPPQTPRQRTARMLEAFDRRSPRVVEDIAKDLGITVRDMAIGVLMRHGYLKRKGVGLVRTKKEFTA